MDAMIVRVERRAEVTPADAEAAGAQLSALSKDTIGVTADAVVQNRDITECSSGTMRGISDERLR